MRFDRKTLGGIALAALLIIYGIPLAVGGIELIRLGGSSYFLAAGTATMISGLLLLRWPRAARLCYAATFLGTLIWASMETGGRLVELLPRITLPALLGLALFLPALRPRAGWGNAAKDARLRLGLAVFVAAAILSLAGYAVLSGEGRTSSRSDHAIARDTVADSEWASWGGTPHATRYAAIDQINRSNVGRLELAWTYKIEGAPSSFEVTPLKVGDRLFLCSPNSIVISLDAQTGRQLWRFDPKVARSALWPHCRGVSYFVAQAATECPRRILVTTADARLMAIDADRGTLCRTFGNRGAVPLTENIGKLTTIYSPTSAPAIVNGIAIVGAYVGDNVNVDVPSGVIRGYDALTGKQRWAFDTGSDDPNAPLKPGDVYSRGSPNFWSTASGDPELGLVFVPTGNPSPDLFGGRRRAADERNGSSVLAIEAATGKLRWRFQTVHHDLWDYDVPAQPLLWNMPTSNGAVPALIVASKSGQLFILDRRTGQPLSPVVEHPVPRARVAEDWAAPTQPLSPGMPSFLPEPVRETTMWGLTPIDLLWCRIQFKRYHYEGAFTPPSEQGSISYPNDLGAIGWGGVTLDEGRQILLVNSNRMMTAARLVPRSRANSPRPAIGHMGAGGPMKGTPYKGERDTLLSFLGIPCNAPPWGMLTAISLRTKQILWQRPIGTTRDSSPIPIGLPLGVFNFGGSITTRGGLTFIGATLDHYLRAFDTETGRSYGAEDCRQALTRRR